MLTHNDFSWSPYGLLWSSNPNTVYTPGFGHRSNGINSFYQTDWLGSTRYVTDITGSTVMAAQSYDAWGHRDAQAPGSPNWPTDMQFAGAWGYQSEWSNSPNEPGLGLDYLQQRYYDPVVGRFMEPDPLGFAAGTNLFEYADDDPVDGVDPTGLDDQRPGWAKGVENGLTTVGAILGGLGGVGVGGGGGFAAGIVTGPGAVVTAGAGALELGALGAAGGAATGKAVGRALTGALLYFAARASGGSGGSSGGGSDCRKPSEILRQNFIDAGMEASPGDEAHHIVPEGHRRAALARDLLDAFGIDVNSAANGVFLPGPEGEGEGVPHRTVHTYASIDFVTDLLAAAPDRAGAEAALDLVRQLLKSGILPR